MITVNSLCAKDGYELYKCQLKALLNNLFEVYDKN